MEYFVADFTITCPPDLIQVARDLVADAAANAGFESFEDTDAGLKGYVQKELLDRAVLDGGLENLFLDDTEVTYTLQDAENKDWNEEWEKTGFDPINIQNKVFICDARKESPEVPEGTIPVYIYARQAFGTGTHETTRMIISTLLGLDLKDAHVLDCGCGTGILGIVASKLDAEHVASYDIDEWSVDNTRHNAERNGIDNLTVYHGNASVLSHISGLYHIVLANINRNILLNDLPAFKEMLYPGGTIIISGFYEEDAPLLLEKAESLGLHEVNRVTDSGWCCLILQ